MYDDAYSIRLRVTATYHATAHSTPGTFVGTFASAALPHPRYRLLPGTIIDSPPRTVFRSSIDKIRATAIL